MLQHEVHWGDRQLSILQMVVRWAEDYAVVLGCMLTLFVASLGITAVVYRNVVCSALV